ncbi:hypothetical protein BDV23DRAFT_170203 [Aspergillus alliaceus]|uniref:Aminoglycoside phosphotransferase domain-containing protein n=1 Tax=Petromyces alliaceus TaxID=209559 RepID=A0A5N7CHG8_PETAA|nr:hypothetical protein BDV23DRAFT_170203 [Aspergillus alliaceus]
MQSAHPRMDHYRSNTESDPPTEYMDLIEKYLLVVPHLTPYKPDSVDLLQPTLWHGSLHLNNIYVDLNTSDGRHISPPLGWIMPEKPEDYVTLSEKDRHNANRLYESTLCHKYYEVWSAKRHLQYYAAISYYDTWKSPLIQEAFRSRKEFAQQKMENREYIEGLMEESQGSGILPSDGIVDTDDYDIVQKTNYMRKEKFLLAETEE